MTDLIERLAKQLFNGCRIYLQAAKTLERAAKPIPNSKVVEGETSQ